MLTFFQHLVCKHFCKHFCKRFICLHFFNIWFCAPLSYRIVFILMVTFINAIALTQLKGISLGAWCGFWLTS